MINMERENKEFLQTFAEEKNIKDSTHKGYHDSVKIYTKVIGKSMPALIKEADGEEEEGIRWKNRKLKKHLNNFTTYLEENYKLSSINIHLTRIKTIYKYYEIEIGEIRPINKKNVEISEPISYADLPDKEIIKKALKISDPLMRAVIVFMASSGCSRTETLSLTIQDYINATSDYHNSNDINDVINELENTDDVIPMFKIKRIKTNKYYYAFCSPEAVQEINNYLLTRESLKKEDKLFDIISNYLNTKFRMINDTLKLGNSGTYGVFRPHMLRKFFASNMVKSGLPMETVNTLEGRTKGNVNESYFFDDPYELKQKYADHMDAVLINWDFEKITVESPEVKKIMSENQKLKKQNTEITKLKKRFKELEGMFDL